MSASFSSARQTEFLRLLSLAAAHLLETDDPDLLVRGIFQIASPQIGIDTYFNYMVVEGSERMELASCAGIPDDVAASIRRLEFGQAICGTVAQLRKPIVATHIQTSDYDKAALVRGLGIRAYACNPLMHGGQILGTLSFASRTRDTFDEDELEFFRAVCRYAEMAIHRVQLLRRLRHHASLLDLATDAIISMRLDGTITYWSSGAELIYGWSAAEAGGSNIHLLLQTKFPRSRAEVEEILLEVGSWEGELIHTTRNGRRIHVSCKWALQTDENGAPTGILEVNRDITERRRLEEQLRQSQKMESLGVLAGGIAHDFNNILVGILGNASLLQETLPDDDPNRPLADAIAVSGERASTLTRQLLAYAGKGRYEIQSIDLTALARDVGALVQAALPKHVAVEFVLDPKLPAVRGDVAQLQQVLMNLIINAAEAVGEKNGSVRVATSIRHIDSAAAAAASGQYELQPGLFVAVEVSDTGCGMDEATAARIFDPFFTTKLHGRGLGLSAVQGILRGHKGAIELRTAPGEGTSFSLLLPAGARIPHAEATKDSENVQAPRDGVVLVVDDEEIVRSMAKAALERAGYSVILARDGDEAVGLFSAHPEITAVLLDSNMPGMDGPAILSRLKHIRPGVPVILSSGLAQTDSFEFANRGAAAFLQKPYTARQIASLLGRVARETVSPA